MVQFFKNKFTILNSRIVNYYPYFYLLFLSRLLVLKLKHMVLLFKKIRYTLLNNIITYRPICYHNVRNVSVQYTIYLFIKKAFNDFIFLVHSVFCVICLMTFCFTHCHLKNANNVVLQNIYISLWFLQTNIPYAEAICKHMCNCVVW